MFYCAQKSQRKLPEQFISGLRLINPAKNELEWLSKFIIEAMNKELTRKLNINQWKNTEDVIDWFKSINDKSFINSFFGYP